MENRTFRSGSTTLAGASLGNVRPSRRAVPAAKFVQSRFFRRFLVGTSLVSLVLAAGWVQAAGLKTLQGHIPAAIARMNLQPIGNVPATTRLQLAIGLPLRHQAALTDLLRQLYDPASTNYHQFLTPAQFTEQFGPSPQDYQAVMAFAKANGLTVSRLYSNRMLVDVSAPVAKIDRAFHVQMRLYRHPTENRNFYAPDVEPTVPAGLPIRNISGFNDYALPRPMLQFTPISQTNSAKPGLGSGPFGSYWGYDFRNAYAPKVSLTGAGQTVGLLEFDGYFPSDISDYVTQAGLPSVPLQVVPVNGGVPTPGFNNVEVALDIDMVNAMAPGLSKIAVFEATNGTPWVDMLNAMALDTSIKQFSSSWGGGPNPVGTNGVTSDQIFQEMAAQGQSFFQASGDSDAYIGSIPFPSDEPYITVVGGTTLSMSGAGSGWAAETVWNWGVEIGLQYDGVGSSGGVSPTYTIPSWQQGIEMIANQGSTTMRNLPDVAMTADNIWIFADDGLQGMVGGTSAAAPLWAGFTALANQQASSVGHPPVGFINPAIYAIAKGQHYASDFHDITTGNNTWSGSPDKYFAVPGYDLCTGLGTPNGQNLIGGLLGKRLGILQLSVNPPTGSALLQNSIQPISVTVNDIYGVTNATVTAFVTNSLGLQIAALTDFVNNGGAVYGNSLPVPAAANPLAMTVIATAPGEIGTTNVVNYSVISAPPNDNFASATGIPATGGSYVENNRFATLEPGEPKHDGDQLDAASLWWVWKPANSTNAFLDTIGSKVDNVLAVYTGNALTNLQSVAATNSALAGYKPAQLTFNAHVGTKYYIAVAGVNPNSLGTVALQLLPGGQPDTNAPVVTVTNPPSGTPAVGHVQLVIGTAADSGVNPSGVSQVFTAINGTTLNALGTTNWTSVLPLQVGENSIQAWAVDGAGNFSATNSIQVSYFIQGPPNDFFVHAISLSGTGGTVSATNIAASKEVGEPDPAGNPGGKSLWWSFTPTTNGVLTLNTTNSSFDTIMGLYTGATVSSLTPIAANDDAYPGATNGFSYISQAVRAGQKYYILVDGYDGASGTISLRYAFTPATVYQLTVNSSGGGSVQLTTTNPLGGIAIVPGSSGNFASGSRVILTALPDHNDQFESWSGGVNSTSNPLTVTMNSDLAVTANFVPRQFTDGFESGDFSHLPWVTPDPNRTNDFPWIVQSNVVDVGQYAAESWTNLLDSQSSSLILSNTFTSGTGSFDFKVSSEPNFDILSFSVDGVVRAQWSGEVGWQNYSFPLTAGPHMLEWTYAKDPTISLGMDAAFLDDVDLPIGSASPGALQPQIELQQQPGGGLLMNVVGQTNQEYVIQSSPDLVHWQNVSTNTAVGGFISIPVPANGTNHAQFYRAVAP